MNAEAEYVTIHPDSLGYPDALREIWARDKQPTLYAIGNLELLEKPGIGFCGSRNATEDALELALELGRVMARNDRVVVSGNARGVDRQAQRGALEAGGSTIAVLPEGIEQSNARRDLAMLREEGLEDNFLAVSMFEPRARWAVWRAMERNTLIVGFSVGLVVVEAREKGGTMDAAKKCSNQRGKKLWVVDYPDATPHSAGNRMLLKKTSAIPVRLSKGDDMDWAFVENGLAAVNEQLSMGFDV